MRVVIAPDCFTGTLTAPQAAAAMAEGWAAHAPVDELVSVPLSDGGPGFVDAVSGSVEGRLVTTTVPGPLGEPVPATLLLVEAADDPSGRRTAYLESAQACGAHLVGVGGFDPARSSTVGVGQLLVEAVAAGAERVVVGLGGSATVDGGAGLLAALGVSAARADLTTGPRGLSGIDATAIAGLDVARARLAGVELVLASDVDVPLLGRHGAVFGFARQKGATAEALPGLEASMTAWASALIDAAGRAGAVDPGRLVALPGAGAAGGLGMALLALGGARVPGVQAVADAVRLGERLDGADLVLTGEGSFDWQSLRGKVVSGVAAAAAERAVPVVVVAGQVSVGRRELAVAGVAAAYAVADTPEQIAASVAAPAAALTRRTTRVARTWHR